MHSVPFPKLSLSKLLTSHEASYITSLFEDDRFHRYSTRSERATHQELEEALSHKVDDLLFTPLLVDCIECIDSFIFSLLVCIDSYTLYL